MGLHFCPLLAILDFSGHALFTVSVLDSVDLAHAMTQQSRPVAKIFRGEGGGGLYRFCGTDTAQEQYPIGTAILTVFIERFTGTYEICQNHPFF